MLLQETLLKADAMNALPTLAATATLDEIAKALGVHRTSVIRRANKESWPFETVAVRGGQQRRYPLASLPKSIRATVSGALLNVAFDQLDDEDAIKTPPAIKAANAIVLREADPGLNRKQLDCERARERIFKFIDDFEGSVEHAADHLNAGRQSRTLSPALMWAMDNAWDKARKDHRLTKRTYYQWLTAKTKQGRAAPKKIQKDMAIKPWYPPLLELIQRPQGACFTWIVEQLAACWNPAWGDSPPSYHAVRRACREKLSIIDQLKGRFTGSQLRSFRHFNIRTSEGMLPWQEVHADGWNTHFKAPHPISGEYVTYEVWHFHDVATRFVPPPGIGLSETYEVITAGLERCVRAGGIPAVLQTDSTKVIKKSPRFTMDPYTALAERAGFEVVHPVEVGNSQANGIAENFNTWLDKQCRELATYQGKGMDSLTFKRVGKITANMVKAAKKGDLIERDRLQRQAVTTGKGVLFTSYAEACAWINAKINAFNEKPHRSLPKIADPVTGKRRHQSPREAIQAHIDAGWQPTALAEEQIVDLFRPHVRCKVVRESVSPVGNGQRYHFSGLGAWNGQEVMAAIDPMDYRQVWVKTLEGTLIGVAEMVTATGYRADTFYEMAEEKRARAQIKRNNKKNTHIVETRMTRELEAPSASQVIIAGQVINSRELVHAPALSPSPSPASGRGELKTDSAAFPLSPRPLAGEGAGERAHFAQPRSARIAEENVLDWLAVCQKIERGEAVSAVDQRFSQSWPKSTQARVFFEHLGETPESYLFKRKNAA